MVCGVLRTSQLRFGPKIPPEHPRGREKEDRQTNLPVLPSAVQTGTGIAPIGVHVSQQLPLQIPTLRTGATDAFVEGRISNGHSFPCLPRL